MVMSILVVDDEQPARERLVDLISELDAASWQVAGTAANGEQAVTFCQQQAVDIVMMDIRMPGMDGLQAAQLISEVPQPPAIIFTTAYSDYALEAFDANGAAYLLKPVRPNKLLETLNKVQRPTRAQRAGLTPETTANAYLSGSYRGGVIRVGLDEVICLQAEQKYVVACCPGREVLIDTPLVSIEENYPGRFLRVHRNALVAPDAIQAMEKTTDGQTLLVLNGCERKPEVSRRHLSALRKLMKGA